MKYNGEEDIERENKEKLTKSLLNALNTWRAFYGHLKYSNYNQRTMHLK